MSALSPITLGKDNFFFEKKQISSASFGSSADIAVTLKSKNSLLIVNQGPGVIEVSFNGNTVHAELNLDIGTGSIAINDPSIVKIWFRLKSGAPSVVLVQNDAVPHGNTVSLTVGSIGGTSSNFNDFFPAVGTAVGFNDGTDMQGARVYDTDTGAGTEYTLGSVLRASDNGGSVETGTEAHPLVTSLRTSDKGTTAAGNVTSEDVDANVQALHVYVKGTSNGNSNPLMLDGYSIMDAFGRLRFSQPVTLFDSKQIYNGVPGLWDDYTINGASITYQTNRASSLLQVSSTIGSRAIRQSKIRTTYQPGKSLLIMETFVMGGQVSGISKKAGYFDDNNGVFFENTGSVNRLVIRSYVNGSANETYANQNTWNIDTFDGLGQSGIDLDLTKAQIFVTDIEWLGVGSVRCGFVIGGSIYYVHKFDHANVIDSVYMSTPNLPARFEIENISSGVGSTLEEICVSISSEAGFENKGFSHVADRGISPLLNVNNAQLYPLVSVRIKSSGIGTQIQPQFIDIFCTSSNANFYWQLIINPTIAGVDGASWTSINNSNAEYDVSRGLTNYVTGGYVLASGYAAQKVATLGTVVNGNFLLGSNIDGSTDEIVLAVQKFGGGSDNFVGAITWTEFI